MGLTNFFKKHFFEDTEGELDIEEWNDLVYDSDEYEPVVFSGKKEAKDANVNGNKEIKKEGKKNAKKDDKTVKEAKKKRNAQEEQTHLKEEEERYNNLLNNLQAQELNKALNITDKDVRLRTLERVNIENYSSEDVSNYVKSQCEIMEESSRHIDIAMEQYTDVAEHFSDIEKYENAPELLQRQIAAEAERVDNLTVDRRIYKASENKLSNSTYHLMETYENDIPKTIAFIEKHETQFENIKHDMRAVEGEQMALRLEARTLKRRQINIKHAAMTTMICLAVVFSIFVIAIVASEDESNMVLFLVVTALSAILALGMYAILRNTHRSVQATEIKLNKTTNLLNKVKIRYVNAINVLDFEYEKYKVSSAYELTRKYETYLEMKEEQKNILEMTSKLGEAEERLVALLRQIGMVDCNIWAGQVRALYNRKEMVEIRHEYAVQRQKLREQIEYNEKRIDEAKKNIKMVTKKYPNFTGEILRIIDRYEKRNRKVNL